ncbi:MAG: 4-hydroxy-tetrahydrodipicolinate synthase [Planctomycetes bacterium]|nr:4-hydroxy-tetrahydrodipicolinate synthase [Planctomycetota bacterium]
MSSHSPFHGSFVALPTFYCDGKIDLRQLAALMDHHVDVGTDGLLVCGTTGESVTLSEFEQRRVMRFAAEHAAGRLPVIAGVGTNSTAETVQLAGYAEEVGVDALLVVTPYYNKPSPNGLRLHYGEVAAATKLPIFLYNNPGRTGCDLDPDLAADLARTHETIVAVKEAAPGLERARRHLALGALDLFCGEDSLLADYVALGARGSITVTANLLPEDLSDLFRVGGPERDQERANTLAARIAPIAEALFCESSPVPVKWALSRIWGTTPDVRAPLAPLEPESEQLLEAALLSAGLLDRELTHS